MTHGSLFSGIGGFDLAAEWMGWKNKFHCEWNEFGQKVLKYYWPESELFTDITKSDFTEYANQIDVLTGGFPCQPYSVAGKRLGKEDERHLWPEMLRAIREIQPRWVVGENVRGLVNWNGGLVFEEVQTDLESQGYEVQPFLLPAASVNAPHRRDRVWFVAYSDNKRRSARLGQIQKEDGEISQRNNNAESCATSIQCNASYTKSGKSREQAERERWKNIERRNTNTNGNKAERPIHAPNSENSGFETRFEGQRKEQLRRGNFGNGIPTDWENFPTVSPICNGDDGLSDRLDSITFPKWRTESIKAGGNAIVPQVVFQIFKAIQEYESITKNSR